MSPIRQRLFLILASLALVISGFFVAPPRVSAATITVDTATDPATPTNGDGCTLREAIQNANDGAQTYPDCDPGSAGEDTIEFSVASITLANTDISIIDTLVIQGPITLSGGGATRIFTIGAGTSVRLSDVELTNGATSGAGGAVLVNNGATLTIEQGNINNNQADGNGGAISSNGTLDISNTIFEDNSAGGDGGAIHQSSSFSMTVTQTGFLGNSAGNNASNADGSGGAIYHNGAVSAPSAITGVFFQNNSVVNADSADGGGAIFHNNGILNIFGSGFSGNTADGDDARGGAIFNNSTNDLAMAIEYSHFGETLSIPLPLPAPLNVLSLTDPNRVTGTSETTAGGGAIYNFGPLLVLGSSFIGNTSSNHGGAFHNTAAVSGNPPLLTRQVMLANSTFSGNSATNDGGAIYHNREDNLLQLVNVTIADNTANSGGGIFNQGDGESPSVSNFDDLYITNSILANNTPANCAGGTLGNGSSLASGGNVVFGSACAILQQDGASTPTTPATGDPVLDPPQLTFSFPTIVTFARALGSGSSASGFGDPAICSAVPVLNLDQRVFPRPAGAPNCDSGAYESDQPPPAPEIDVQGNGSSIANGDATPSLTDHTDFGSTTTGTPISRTFTVLNTGTADLTLGALTVPAGFTVTTAPTSPVAASGSTTFVVECTAASAATFSGNISLVNNDSDENPYVFAITCAVTAGPTPVYASTAFAPGSTIGFGNVAVGDFADIPLTISEVGTADLVISTISISGAGFSIESITPPVPFTIVDNSGDTVALVIRCTPSAPGLLNGTLTVTHNAAGSPAAYALRCGIAVSDSTPSDPGAPAPQISVFDPAISKIGFLLPGQLGVTGELLEWVVTVSNTGGAPGSNVTVTDTLNANLTIDRVEAPGAAVSISGQTVTVIYPTLNPGQSAVFSIFTIVNSGVTVENTACVGDRCATGQVVRQLPDTGETPAWRLPAIALMIAGLAAAGWLILRPGN